MKNIELISDVVLRENVIDLLQNKSIISRKEGSAILMDIAKYTKVNYNSDVGIPAACASSAYSASEYFNLSRSDDYIVDANDLERLDKKKYLYKIFLYRLCSDILRKIDYSIKA